MIIRLKQLILLLFFSLLIFSADCQVADTTLERKDSSIVVKDSSSTIASAGNVSVLCRLIAGNRFLNSKATPVTMAIKPRKAIPDDGYFYLLLGVVLLFGIAKAAYQRYFANLFRVFFNSSLRQSQLTDQLVQDQLPSLVFNILFVIAGGIYLYFLVHYFNRSKENANWQLLLCCVLLFTGVYFVKYLTLKFTGWVTGFKQEADIYTFIIFLINKIIGICLLPVVIVMAFSDKSVAAIFIYLSFILIALLLLMRFFRSYGLLQTRIKVSRFHFFLYIFSVEILPLFIIYKAVMLFFNKNW